MDSMPGSTIAALCYARDTEIAFDVVTAALSTHPAQPWKTGGGATLDLPTGDFALCDRDGQRIGVARVALDRTFPGTPTGRHFPTCLLISVGPDGTVPATQPRHDRVLASLLLRMQEIAPADRVLMFERAGAFDSAVHDEVIDDLRGHLDKVLAPREASRSRQGAEAQAECAPPLAAAAGAGTVRAGHAPAHAGLADRGLPPAPTLVPPLAPTLPPAPAAATAPAGTSADPDDIVHLAQRLETELDRLVDMRRTLVEEDMATDRRERRGLRRGLPQGFPRLAPAPARLFVPKSAQKPAQARDSRPDTAYPDYEDMPANINERPLLHRAAVNALNVTVMTIALPVGAALITMSALGREDMLTSSRVTAVTGVAVALHNTGVTGWVQALFT